MECSASLRLAFSPAQSLTAPGREYTAPVHWNTLAPCIGMHRLGKENKNVESISTDKKQ